MTGNRERVALACLVAGALLAGGNGVSIRFSNRELPPLWGAGLRFSLAAALLLVIMAVLRLPFPRGRAPGPRRSLVVRHMSGSLLMTLRPLTGAEAGVHRCAAVRSESDES
jgi:drug/metabolite transporter (DMT)-like permease